MFLIGVVVMAYASPVDAHYFGLMSVRGNENHASDYSKTVGDGISPEQGCFIKGGARATAATGWVDVYVEPGAGASGCDPKSLAPGLYNVYVYNGRAYEITYVDGVAHYKERKDTLNSTISCLGDRPNQPGTKWRSLGTMTINPDGTGSGGSFQFTGLGLNPTVDPTYYASAICISNGVEAPPEPIEQPPGVSIDQGNMVPLQLT